MGPIEPIMQDPENKQWIVHIAHQYRDAKCGLAKKMARSNFYTERFMSFSLSLSFLFIGVFLGWVGYGSIKTQELELMFAVFLSILFVMSSIAVCFFPFFEMFDSWKILQDQKGSELTKKEQELMDDPIARLAYLVVEAEPEIISFLQQWNSYARRRDLGILKANPELEKMGPVAKQVQETFQQILFMTSELIAMRKEQKEREPSGTLGLAFSTDVDITETLEMLRTSASHATAYVQAYQEVEGSALSCPLEAIAQIEKVQAELRRDLPQSQKLELARKVVQRTPA